MLHHLLDGIFPQSCILCSRHSQRTWPLCQWCQADLQPNSYCCRRCAIPLPAAGGARLCGDCLQQPPPFLAVTAPWLYDERLAHIIRRWKYHGEHRLTALLAWLWLCGPGRPEPVDLLIPVPLHWRKLWQRGFNQSEQLCRQLHRHTAASLGGAVNTKIARRRRYTTAQSGMNRHQRGHNLQGAFTASGACDNLHVAIVDDVLTTGATASALASTLISAGAQRVDVWCLARTPPPGS